MLAVMAAGLQGVELSTSTSSARGAGGAGLISTDAPELQYIGRMERKRVDERAAVRLSWSGNELRALHGVSRSRSASSRTASATTRCGSTSSPAACTCVASAANGC